MSRYEVTDVKGKPSDPGGMVVTLNDKYAEYERQERESDIRRLNTITLSIVLLAIFSILILLGAVSLSGKENQENDIRIVPRESVNTDVDVAPLPKIEFEEADEPAPEMDTEGNFRVGCSLLADYLKTYGDTHKALMVYNMGAGGASKAWAAGCTSSCYSRAIVDYMARLG